MRDHQDKLISSTKIDFVPLNTHFEMTDTEKGVLVEYSLTFGDKTTLRQLPNSVGTSGDGSANCDAPSLPCVYIGIGNEETDPFFCESEYNTSPCNAACTNLAEDTENHFNNTFFSNWSTFPSQACIAGYNNKEMHNEWITSSDAFGMGYNRLEDRVWLNAHHQFYCIAEEFIENYINNYNGNGMYIAYDFDFYVEQSCQCPMSMWVTFHTGEAILSTDCCLNCPDDPIDDPKDDQECDVVYERNLIQNIIEK